jgi:uncharacterized protein (TIGR03067 family)
MDMPKHGLPKKLVIKGGKMSGGPKVIALATDATKTPRWLNCTWDGEDFTAHGIYELNGGELKICLPMSPGTYPVAPGNEPGEGWEKKRPAGFDTKNKPEMVMKLKAVK